MSNSRREVWEKAKETGCDGFISAVSRVFGSDAIGDVCVSDGVTLLTTSDSFAHNGYRVIPGVKISNNESKEVRSAKK